MQFSLVYFVHLKLMPCLSQASEAIYHQNLDTDTKTRTDSQLED
jgi:hypothetical protein